MSDTLKQHITRDTNKIAIKIPSRQISPDQAMLNKLLDVLRADIK